MSSNINISVQETLDTVSIGVSDSDLEVNILVEENTDSEVNISIQEGRDGYTPVKGVDYFDGRDGRDGNSVRVNNVGQVNGNIVLTTDNIPDDTDKRYVTDAELVVIGNTSGINTGDNAANTTSNTYADGKVAQTITNGVTSSAPSQDVVYDALANKKDYFSENTAFNKNFGTTAGTVAAGDDSRFDKNITVASTVTTAGHTGNTTETVKYTVSIPANTFTTGDKIYQEILLTAIGLAGVKTIKTYINTTADLAGTPVLISTYFTNHLLYSLLSSFFVDSTSSMKSYKLGSSNSATYWGSSNSSLGTFSINWTVQQYLVLSVQLENATDLIKLEALIFKRERI